MTTITITGERLQAMHDNDMRLYHTPGDSDRTYWSARANFRDDYAVADVWDLLDQYGIGIDEIDADETYEFEVSTERQPEAL
jgi:hypothetical protein